jgi:leader peptidase (prepilin peptidase)/N-methyltransferase
MTATFAIFAFILGAVLGSFFNVVGLRVPKGESIISPPSHCPNCGRWLTAGDLIPVVSYFFLRGKCRSCRSKISFIYPLVELLTASLFAFAYMYSGLNATLIVSGALISLLIIIFVTDIRYQIIPDKLLIFFALFFLIIRLFIPFRPWLDGLFGAGVGFGTLLLIAVISRGNMGGGDIKLFAVLGFVLGVKGVLLAFFFSCLYGSVIGICALLSGKIKRGQPIPFGPYIVLGTLTSYFYGETLWHWYLQLF